MFDACLDLRFAHDVGLEHQAEALGVVVDEVEERLDRGADTLFVVRRRSQGLAYTRDEAVDVTLQDCDVQFEFAWEMLVQNWLADTGTFGDLVHAGRVVPVRNEYLTCSCEELEAARIAREAGAATCSGRLASRCTAIGVSPIREFCHVASNLSKSNSVGARIRESRVRTRQYPPSHRS